MRSIVCNANDHISQEMYIYMYVQYHAEIKMTYTQSVEDHLTSLSHDSDNHKTGLNMTIK
jgi:hypothetical protein